MKTLYVAGDSFASLSPNQEKGKSWSELLADNLTADLINISRPGASNTTIAIQIDWITSRVTEHDVVVVFLTDHYRQTLPNPSNPIATNKSLLERHSVHYSQVPFNGIAYSEPAELVSSVMVNGHLHAETQDYYKKWFDPNLVQFQDRMIISGALTFLLNKTSNILVVSGGFESDPTLVPSDLNIPANLFCEFSAKKMLQLGADYDRGNHLCDNAHMCLANMFNKRIQNSS